MEKTRREILDEGFKLGKKTMLSMEELIGPVNCSRVNNEVICLEGVFWNSEIVLMNTMES